MKNLLLEIEPSKKLIKLERMLKTERNKLEGLMDIEDNEQIFRQSGVVNEIINKIYAQKQVDMLRSCKRFRRV